MLTTVLVTLNYTRGLVDLFTFFILLSTLNTLVPFVFSSLAVFLLAPAGARARLPRGMAFAAALAFAYSLWAIGGAGQETIYWGFLLLVCGLPVYVCGRQDWPAETGQRRAGRVATCEDLRGFCPGRCGAANHFRHRHSRSVIT